MEAAFGEVQFGEGWVTLFTLIEGQGSLRKRLTHLPVWQVLWGLHEVWGDLLSVLLQPPRFHWPEHPDWNGGFRQSAAARSQWPSRTPGWSIRCTLQFLREDTIEGRVAGCQRDVGIRCLRYGTLTAGASLLAVTILLSGGCAGPRTVSGSAAGPAIEFTTVPLAGADNPEKLSPIKGRVIGAKSGQQIVLYAKGSTTWWVQPFADRPFTQIQGNSNWSSETHPGAEYAALLVAPDFSPPPTTDVLPTEGVLAVALSYGATPLWQRWWFPFVCVIAGVLAIFGIHRLRLHQMTKKLNVRFEERLAERMRVAQELHDTLLQGVLSASMQLHVALEKLPPDSPAQPALSRILELMGQVVEEGRNTVRGLRSTIGSARDLEESFSRIPQELSFQQEVGFRVIVEGPALPLQPAIRTDVYSIGREALLNAIRHSRATNIEVELEYAAHQLRVLVRDNGCGIDPDVLQSGRDGHWGLSGMRERAERIGARLRVLSSAVSGTEVELRVPSRVAFESPPSSRASKWLAKLSTQHNREAELEHRHASRIDQ